jgi:hypothetical protein
MESRFHIGPTRGGDVTLTLNAKTNGRRTDRKSLVFKACKPTSTGQQLKKPGKGG